MEFREALILWKMIKLRSPKFSLNQENPKLNMIHETLVF